MEERSLTDKIRHRVRRAVRTGATQPRVWFFRDPNALSLTEKVDEAYVPILGVYKLVHHLKHVPFRIDKRQRVYLYTA